MSSAPPPTPTSAAGRVDWTVTHSHGPADAFHRQDPRPDPGHQLWVHVLPTPALILGSTQPDDLITAARAKADAIEVCRRRSGGGLVYLDPATDCWIDAIVPAGSPLWSDDVGRAFHWLGQAWARTIAASLPGGPTPVVHRPRPGRGQTGRPLWCFAGLGHGEVTLLGLKIVGLSQRRTRSWIRLQSMVLGAWPGRQLMPYLDLDVARRLAEPGSSARADGSDRPAPAVDPGLVPAGPPPGLRLPAPAELSERLTSQLIAATG